MKPPANRLALIGRATEMAQLSLADWWRTGRHEKFRVVALHQQVSYFAAHEVTHLSQIGALHWQWVAGE